MSFHHVNLLRLKPGITLDRVRQAREQLAALVETLPGVHHFAVTDNLSPLNGGYTLALFSSFDGRTAYDVCMRHPEYRRVWEELVEPIVERRLVAEGED